MKFLIYILIIGCIILLTQYHIFCHLHLLITDMYQACTHPIAAVSRFPEYTEKQNIGHDRRNVVKL